MELRPERAGLFTLALADDGVGIPDGIKISSLRSLGLRLESDLAAFQLLEGTPRFGEYRGTMVEASFRERQR